MIPCRRRIHAFRRRQISLLHTSANILRRLIRLIAEDQQATVPYSLGGLNPRVRHVSDVPIEWTGAQQAVKEASLVSLMTPKSSPWRMKDVADETARGADSDPCGPEAGSLSS